MPVGCAAHTPEPMTPPMPAAVTPTVACEASSAPLTGSRRCIEPRPPLSATLTIRTEPEELPAIEVLNPPGRSMTFSAFPVRGDTRTSRSPRDRPQGAARDRQVVAESAGVQVLAVADGQLPGHRQGARVHPQQRLLRGGQQRPQRPARGLRRADVAGAERARGLDPAGGPVGPDQRGGRHVAPGLVLPGDVEPAAGHGHVRLVQHAAEHPVRVDGADRAGDLRRGRARWAWPPRPGRSPPAAGTARSARRTGWPPGPGRGRPARS